MYTNVRYNSPGAQMIVFDFSALKYDLRISCNFISFINLGLKF